MAAPNRHYELKKLQLFIKFTFIGHTNLKFGEHKKKAHLKYSFCCSLDSAALTPLSRTPLVMSLNRT